MDSLRIYNFWVPDESADRFGNAMSNVVDVEDDANNDLIEEQVTPQPSVSSSNPRLLNPFHRYNIGKISYQKLPCLGTKKIMGFLS